MRFYFLFLLAGLLAACNSANEVVIAPVTDGAFEPPPASVDEDSLQAVRVDSLEAAKRAPAWARDVVWYQIFPERFRNGDPTNDPIRDSIEDAERAPDTWALSPWTGDWYERAEWETQMGESFYDAVFHRRYGGDLQGVIDQLPYLDSLGVTGIYFNPVFFARSLHKYDGSSFHHIDPYFGPDPQGDLDRMAEEDPADPSTWIFTSADSLFLDLLSQAHEREMRVIIDGVFNHTGRSFFAFDDLWSKGAESEFADWYVVTQFDDPETEDDEFDYEGWWGYKHLPVFADAPGGNDLAAGPKQYVLDATRRWMDPNGDGDPSDGIDGWRLDVAEEVPTGFWRDWNAFVRELNPEAYTVAEIWTEADAFLEAAGFSAAMNYFGFALPVKGWLVDDQLDPTVFAAMLDLRQQALSVPVRYAMQNLVDSHDTPRIAQMIVNRSRPYTEPAIFDYDRQAGPRDVPDYDTSAPDSTERDLQRMVALMQMTYVGAPMLYYGTEAGMWGADDPDDRMPMVWPDLTYEPQRLEADGTLRDSPQAVAFDSTLFDFYKRVIQLRTSSGVVSDVLRRGAYQRLTANDTDGTFAFGRVDGRRRLIAAFNRSDGPRRITIPWTQLGAGLRTEGQVQTLRYTPAFV
ncbi:MAG: glycoside hydrolase family 13 protein, partial [Bacteroidota bacterium]